MKALLSSARRLATAQAAALVRDSMARGCGGSMLVIGRDAGHRDLTVPSSDTVMLAGSGPWLSRLTAMHRPPRVRLAELTYSLCHAAATDGRGIFVLGGAPGSPGVPSIAQRAAAVLSLRFRGLRIVGTASSPTAQGWARLCADVVEAKPDLVLMSTDDTSLYRVAPVLRADLPSAWLYGSAKLADTIAAAAMPGSGRAARGLMVVHTAVARLAGRS